MGGFIGNGNHWSGVSNLAAMQRLFHPLSQFGYVFGYNL